ncbi:MAG: hypothetical protein IKD89_04235 [Clostridia bacterium]|nr:hypothetical protein [Clostridia bacterium]
MPESRRRLAASPLFDRCADSCSLHLPQAALALIAFLSFKSRCPHKTKDTEPKTGSVSLVRITGRICFASAELAGTAVCAPAA